jgi:3-dehydroquinate dehydratase/shikimate dehydrogenase
MRQTQTGLFFFSYEHPDMICISVVQESRRLALVDMLNASRQCDLIEVRLDRFGKAPEIGELIAGKPKPILMSCRRPEDGGQWDGTEGERLAILRQCVVNKADYVEIELDAADQVRKLPPTKRVISYTNLEETPADVAQLYQEALAKSPDVVKIAVKAETPEQAWPLVQILAKATVPTIVVGLGKPGIMLTVLGQKLGAPWAYAALERGMESFPGQPTVQDLNETYRFHDLGKGTRFVGVTGFDDGDRATVAALNAAFAANQLPARCLPLGVGSMKLFGKVIDAVKLAAVVVDELHRRAILQLADELDPPASQSRSADLMIHKGDKWRAFDTQSKAVIDALEAAARNRHAGERPLNGRLTLLVGANDVAVTMAQQLKARGAALIIASHDRAAGQRVAQGVEARFIQFEALYSTLHDVLVVCDDEREHLGGKSGLQANYLKPSMTVLDLTASARPTDFLRQARARGCAVVTPQALWLDQVANQARLLTGKDVPRKLLEDAAPWLQEDEEVG